MRKLIAIALLALFATACTPTENAGMMKTGMQCPMMKDGASCCCAGMMKNGTMKTGMQCPMMKGGAKDGKTCCCQKMMEDGMTKKPDGAHKQHHPIK